MLTCIFLFASIASIHLGNVPAGVFFGVLTVIFAAVELSPTRTANGRNNP